MAHVLNRVKRPTIDVRASPFRGPNSSTIVYLADLAFWKMVERGGLTDGEIFDPATTFIKYGINHPRR